MILNKPSQSLDYSQAFLESAANEVDQAMKLSVVIPTYNRCGLLQRVLRGLCEQLASSLLEEVLVVSDGSTDGTPGVVSQFADRLPVRLIEQDKRGVSAARNLGVAQARAPVVLFLDDDVVPAANLIAEHAAFHRRSHELEAVMLGYVTWHPEIAVTPFMRWYGEYGGLYGFSRLRSGQVADRRFLYTCNLSLKTEFFLRDGGFNEALTVMEDHELGYRLSRAGMKMTFLRQAVGYHYQAFRFEDACQRLSRYSSGLPAFLATDAGGLMLAARERPSFRLADMGVRALGPALRIMRPMVDLNIQLPNAVYRLFYWYFATYQSFWGPARRALAARKSAGVQT